MDFNDKVKRNVAKNFDQSIGVYQAFEARHRFFSTYAIKLAESIGIKDGSSVLDVGCGYGLSANVLNARYGCSVLGIDLSPEMIAAERFLEKNERIRLMVEMVKIFHRFSLRVNSITSFSTPQYLFSPTRR